MTLRGRVGLAAVAAGSYLGLCGFLLLSNATAYGSRVLVGVGLHVLVAAAGAAAAGAGRLRGRWTLGMWVIGLLFVAGVLLFRHGAATVPVLGAATGLFVAGAITLPEGAARRGTGAAVAVQGVALLAFCACSWLLRPPWSAWASLGIAGLAFAGIVVDHMQRSRSRSL